MDTKAATRPIVSIIMPAYNCESYIKEAIHSVIAQKFTDWELIIIDDCSTDSTADIVQAFARSDSRIKFVRNSTNAGVAKTRNLGIELSVGEYVAFLDSDDTWHPDKLTLQLQRCKEENADLVYLSYSIVNTEGKSIKAPYIVPKELTFKRLLKENVIGCSTVLIRSETVKRYRFPDGFYHEDYCMWLDMLRDGCKAVGCPEVLVNWRLITSSRSFNKRNSAKKRWKIYREYLGFSFVKSTRFFFSYVLRGIKKYCSYQRYGKK